MRLSTEYEVLVAPTYLYKRFFSVGADMAVPRAALKKAGLTCHFVETQDDGAVEANADMWPLPFELMPGATAGIDYPERQQVWS